MLKIRYYILLGLICICSVAQAQTVDVKIDSLQFLIGEQTCITLDVTLDAKQKLQLPDIRKEQELVPNVEVLDVSLPDTTLLNDGKRLEVQQKYTITAWDSALYYLPPFVVKVDGKPYPSKSLALKVYTVDVDTLHLDRFNPPYDVMDPPFSWQDWRGVVWCSFLLLLLILVAVVLFNYAVNGKPIVRIIRLKKVLPPHKKAMGEIEKIKAERKWTEEDSKEYYTQLTDTLRTYIRERYGFNAMEMTSTEIIERLTAENNEEALQELREIFTTADLVKFAKYSTLINENDANLVAAVEYINQTKQEVDPNAKPEPEVIEETDRRKMNQVKAMKIVAAVAVVLAVVLVAWIVWRTMDILM